MGQQRRQRLEKKALELRNKRIARREEFVKQQRLKQFREQCDELRLNMGHNLTMECDRIRRKRIKEEQQKKEYEKGVDKQYLKIWKQELQKKIDRESRESEYKKNLNNDTAKAVKQQIKEMEEERNRIKLLKEMEIKERVRKLKEAEEFEKLNSIKKNGRITIKTS